MNITLYNTTSPNNKINKTLTNATVLTGDFREETGFLSQVFRVEGMQNRSFNYTYIPDFNRYYYIEEYRSLGHNILELQLKVDVLMSYKTDILNTTVILERTSMPSNAILDINDGSMVSKEGMKDEIYEFQNSPIDFQYGSVILMTVGRVA